MSAARSIVRCGEADIAWYAHGDPGQPGLLLLHSLGLDASMWEPQVSALAGDFRVVTMDMRGHGASSAPPGPYAMSKLAADTLCVADAAGLDRFHLAGLSIGGQIALWLAIHRPRRLASLVLADTAARIGSADGWQERIESVRSAGLEALRERALDIWFTPAFRRAQPGRVDWAGERLTSTALEGYLGCCAALRDSDLRDAAGSVRLPTLVLVGEHDTSTPPHEARWLAEHVPGAELSVIPGAAHIANLEAPDLFSEALAGFLIRSWQDPVRPPS